ncbi:MAG: hypothetical protein H0W95_10675 [Nocardioidaceae bacterium]|nr:hypothetical protein [Nocardioidaceae bacterium]
MAFAATIQTTARRTAERSKSPAWAGPDAAPPSEVRLRLPRFVAVEDPSRLVVVESPLRLITD